MKKPIQQLKLTTPYTDVDGSKAKGKAVLKIMNYNDFDKNNWLTFESNGKEGLSFDGMLPLNKEIAIKLSKFFNKLVKEYD